MEIPSFATKKELFDFLIANKETLIAAKKSTIKHADAFNVSMPSEEVITTKAITDNNDPNIIKVTAVINTTNVIDSHKDVHLPGIWTKTLSENRNIMHLQEHEMKFDKIIADKGDLKASVKVIPFIQLGFNLPGNTEALIFESTIRKERNSFMFYQYKGGHVNNHSIGMQYVKMALAINDDQYGSEKVVWDKYIDLIANKGVAEDYGYFWAITEAKAIEGSAVPLGSNQFTPTLSVEEKQEPSDNDTHKNIEPLQCSTQQAKEIINSLFKTIQ